MLDNLLSMVIAAGLAAGVFLLWWPAHLPSDGVGWLVLRGLAWTLAFEVLALSFIPLTLTAANNIKAQESGMASALLNSAQQIGVALGVAVLTTISVSITEYRLPVRLHPRRYRTPEAALRR